MQVIVVMRLARKKFERLLQDDTFRDFSQEISHGFLWTIHTKDRSPFEIGLANFVRDLNDWRRKVV